MKRNLQLILAGLSAALIAGCGRIGGPYIQVPALTAPQLSSPTNNAVGLDTLAPLDLKWAAVIGAGLYSVQVSTANSFSPLTFSDSLVISDSALIPTTLQANCNYFWRVSVRTSRDSALWSSVRTFTTVAAPGSVASTP